MNNYINQTPTNCQPTGHIRKRVDKNGNISYQLIVDLGKDPLTGKRIRRYFTVKGTKKQAQAKLRNSLNSSMQGSSFQQQISVILLQDWMKKWFNTYLPNIEESTRAGYKEKINNYIIPELGSIPLNALDTDTIQQWVNDLLKKKKLSPKTIKNAFLNLNAALKKAVKLKKIPANPCDDVELPKIKKNKMDFYDTQEINDMMKAAENTDMYLLLLLAVYLGLRRGELIALQWSDIDFNNGIVHVQHNTIKGEKGTVTKAPKSAAGTRSIPTGEKVLKELVSAHKKYNDNKANKKGFVDSGLVICKPDGSSYQPDSISQKWKRFVKTNNLRRIRFHDLRHSCATLMAQAGVPPKVAQQRLGHSNISITMDTYTHASAAMNQQATQLLDELVYQKNP